MYISIFVRITLITQTVTNSIKQSAFPAAAGQLAIKQQLVRISLKPDIFHDVR